MSEKQAGGHVAAKIAAVMGDTIEFSQDGTNKHFKYQYTSVQEAMRQLRPLLAKHNLAIIPSVVSSERLEDNRTITELQMEIIDGDTGDRVMAFWRGEFNDSLDKGTAKSARNGYKYFLLSLFLASAGDEEDADSSGPSPAGKKGTGKTSSTKQPQARAKGQDPLEPEPFRVLAQQNGRYAERTGPKAKPISKDTEKKVIAVLSKGVDFEGSTQADRKADGALVVGWVFPGVDSVEGMTEDEGAALCGAWYDEKDVLNEYAKAEIGTILSEARE